jgi:tetratricopeptide (TPR) repeat protein
VIVQGDRVASTAQAIVATGGEPTVESLLLRAQELRDTDLGRARSTVQQARVLARSRGDRPGEADAMYHLAELAYGSGLSNDAFGLALEARDLAHECGSKKTEVAALNIIAAVQYTAANFSDALVAATSALELYRSTGDRSSEGLLLNSLALIQHSLRDTDRAIVTYEAALMANKGHSRPDLDAITLANMAKVRADRNEHLLAVSLGESALALAREHSREFVPEILARLAISYVALSSLDRAATCLDEAEAVIRDREARRRALSPACAVMVRVARGELHTAQHLREHALRDWADALELAVAANMMDVALDLRERLSNVNRLMGRYEHALVHQEARYELNEQMSARGAELRIRTIQMQHEAERARYEAEIARLRTVELERLVRERADECEEHQAEVLMRVAEMAGPKHADIARHLRAVGELAGEIALELTSDAEFSRHVATAAPLHDIGKLGLPDDLIWKPGPLDDHEYEMVKQHPVLGARILAGGGSECSRMAEEIARCHHERWDGHGYPAGLAGTDIPLSARIVAVADVADALWSQRIYKQSWPAADVVEHVREGGGTHFDPEVVEAFERVVSRRGSAPLHSPHGGNQS